MNESTAALVLALGAFAVFAVMAILTILPTLARIHSVLP